MLVEYFSSEFVKSGIKLLGVSDVSEPRHPIAGYLVKSDFICFKVFRRDVIAKPLERRKKP